MRANCDQKGTRSFIQVFLRECQRIRTFCDDLNAFWAQFWKNCTFGFGLVRPKIRILPMLRSQYPYFGPKSEVSTKDTKYPYRWGLTVWSWPCQCAYLCKIKHFWHQSPLTYRFLSCSIESQRPDAAKKISIFSSRALDYAYNVQNLSPQLSIFDMLIYIGENRLY